MTRPSPLVSHIHHGYTTHETYTLRLRCGARRRCRGCSTRSSKLSSSSSDEDVIEHNIRACQGGCDGSTSGQAGFRTHDGCRARCLGRVGDNAFFYDCEECDVRYCY